MKVQSAIQNRLWLELVIDGKPAWVDTKFALLTAGVAVLLDPDDAPTHWEEATYATTTPDPTDSDARMVAIEGGTKDPVVVVLARRYYDAKNDEAVEFRPGRVSIPTAEEAAREVRGWKELLTTR